MFSGDDRRMPFTLSELNHAIKKPKRNKAGGEEETTSEMLKHLHEDTKLALLDIMKEHSVIPRRLQCVRRPLKVARGYQKS